MSNVTHVWTAQSISLRVDPWVNKNKVSDKAWDWAFEYCIIADNDNLTKYVNLKMLTCHWKLTKNKHLE